VCGGQWGDEGKGKIVAYLSLKDRAAITCRAGTGPNAGHTVTYKGKKLGLAQVPSGYVNESTLLRLGPGFLVDPTRFLKEVELTNTKGRIGLDGRCAIVEPKHIQTETNSQYLSSTLGTTKTGIGPAMADRVLRTARRAEEVDSLKPYLKDVPKEIRDALDKGETVCVEGSQGFGLSLYYGTYPFVTAKDTTAGTFAADVGIGPKKIDEVILVFKTFPTRVGGGSFPTEMSTEEADKRGFVEYGTVTGRRRRVGSFDMRQAMEAVQVNAPTQIAITFADRLDPQAGKATKLRELNVEAQKFINEVESTLKTPVTLISTSPEVYDMIDLRKNR
jgi:adenylosuccinate synthase